MQAGKAGRLFGFLRFPKHGAKDFFLRLMMRSRRENEDDYVHIPNDYVFAAPLICFYA
jgi:hypothetical protein